jgi:hypothetical protein
MVNFTGKFAKKALFWVKCHTFAPKNQFTLQNFFYNKKKYRGKLAKKV